MKENELKFIELVEKSPSNFSIKLERIIKSQVLSQLSRPMLNELFGYWKDNIDEKFNTKAVCMQCAASLFNVTKSIAKKYFELKEIQKNELNNIQEIKINLLDYNNKNGENLKNNFIDIEDDENTVVIDNEVDNSNSIEEKNEIIDVELVEKNEIITQEIEEKTEFILGGETIFDSNTGLLSVTTHLIPVENNEEKITKRGRPKSK